MLFSCLLPLARPCDSAHVTYINVFKASWIFITRDRLISAASTRRRFHLARCGVVTKPPLASRLQMKLRKMFPECIPAGTRLRTQAKFRRSEKLRFGFLVPIPPVFYCDVATERPVPFPWPLPKPLPESSLKRSGRARNTHVILFSAVDISVLSLLLLQRRV